MCGIYRAVVRRRGIAGRQIHLCVWCRVGPHRAPVVDPQGWTSGKEGGGRAGKDGPGGGEGKGGGGEGKGGEGWAWAGEGKGGGTQGVGPTWLPTRVQTPHTQMDLKAIPRLLTRPL